jgi:hypothetical protein
MAGIVPASLELANILLVITEHSSGFVHYQKLFFTMNC